MLALGTVSGTASYAVEAWRCDMPSQKRTSFLGGPLVVAFEGENGKSVASSPLILALYGEPIAIKIDKNTDKVLRASWVIEDVEDAKGNQIPSMRYSGVIQKGSGSFSYYSRSPRYDNVLGTTGRCTRLK